MPEVTCRFSGLVVGRVRSFLRIAAVCFMSALLAGCPWEGGSEDDDGNPDWSPDGSYSVGADVTGLSGNLPDGGFAAFLLTRTDASGVEQVSSLLVPDDGPFVFADLLLDGDQYAVSFRDASDFGVRCEVSNGEGVIAAANVTDIAIVCTPAYMLSGRVRGLDVTSSTGMVAEVLRNGAATVPYNTGFRPDETFFSAGDNGFLPGDTYEVRVASQPVDGKTTCEVDNGTGTFGAADITNVVFYCNHATISYTVTGLLGTGLIVSLTTEVEENGHAQMLVVEKDEVEEDGERTFAIRIGAGEPYEVKVWQQPVGPDQECLVENGVGRISGRGTDLDVTDIEVNCPLPLRKYRFDTTGTLPHPADDPPPMPLHGGELLGGVLYDEYAFGSGPAVPLGSVSGFDTTELFRVYLDSGPQGGIVYSNDTGRTYWLAAISPSKLASDSWSHYVSLDTVWRFRKVSETTSFRLEVTAVNMLAFDDTHFQGDEAFGELWAGADLEVRAHEVDGFDVAAEPFFTAQGGMFLEGTRAPSDPAATHWELVPLIVGSDVDLWSADDFKLDRSASPGGALGGKVAYARLVRTIPIDIDLSDVRIGSDFIVVSQALIEARNSYTNEGGAVVFLQDPAEFDPGVDPGLPGGGAALVETTGVVMVEVGDVPLDLLLAASGGPPAEACEATDRATLSFDAPTTRISEARGQDPRLASAFIRVTRSGSDSGLVTAQVSITQGSAAAGEDFLAGDLEVRFGDGSTAPRVIELPIIDDQVVEADETLTLTLHSPAGCADIGAQSTAQITIVDDDQPPAGEPVYKIGGTVTGLLGSGLVLTNLSTDDLPVTGDGPYAFAPTYPDGFRYEVRVASQPIEPGQVCMASNGSGIVAGADVADVDVSCEALPESNGQLDVTFGQDGRTTTGLPGGATDLALQDDGKVLVVGGNTLARYTADGDIDAGFGSGGTAAVEFFGSAYDKLNAVAVQPDGAIVVAGYSKDGVNSPVQEDFIVARFDANGALDPSFGVDGKVITDFESRGDAAYEILIQPDGGIVVTGSATVADTFGQADSNFAAVRYSSNGELDTAFGTNGMTSVNVAGRTDLGFAAALQPDGKIVLAGRVANSGGDDPDIGLVRLHADGSPDTAFGSDGIVRDQTGDWDEAADLVVQPDGGLVVAGHMTAGGVAMLTIARFNADGSADAGFGDGGRVTDGVMDAGRSIALQPDGRIVVAGLASGDFAIARFETAGALDTVFGDTGLVAVDFFGGADDARAVAIQPDGGIVVAGSAVNGTVTGLGLARVSP